MNFSLIITISFVTICTIFRTHACEEEYSFDIAYQKALEFRDNQIEGYTSEKSMDIARNTFCALSVFGHAKSMHNCGLFSYQKGDLSYACYWFKKAADLGIEASERNLNRIKSNLKQQGIVYTESVPETGNYKSSNIAFCAACNESVQQMLLQNSPATRFWFDQAILKRRFGIENFLTILDSCNFAIMLIKNEGKQRPIRGFQKEISCMITKFLIVLSHLYPDERDVKTFAEEQSDLFFKDSNLFIENLDIVKFYNTIKNGTILFPEEKNYLFDVDLSQKYLDQLISRLIQMDQYYEHATSFIQRETSLVCSFDGFKPILGSIDYIPVIFKQLAEIGIPLHKFLYAEWEYKNSKLSQNLSINFNGFFKDNIQNTWYARAISQIIEEQDAEALNYYRILKHEHGFINLASPFKNQKMHLTVRPRDISKDPSINLLKQYLRNNGASLPYFETFDDSQIFESESLNEEQINILSSASNEKTGKIMRTSIFSKGMYIKFYAQVDPYTLIDSEVNILGILSVEEPIYIKTCKFYADGKIDAPKGAVIVAEEFHITNLKVSNMKNCHFIRVNPVKLDNSFIICDTQQ